MNPDEPPRPAKVDRDQIKHVAEALGRGQPQVAPIAAAVARDKLHRFGTSSPD